MIKKAERHQLKLRMALYGPPGSGKTYTSMLIMHHLTDGAPWGIIDTENRSAELYAPPPGETADPSHGTFTFDTIQLESYEPQNYIDAIQEFYKAGYAGVVIDSLSHAWSGKGGLLDQKERILKQKAKDPFTVWMSLTPQQTALVDIIRSVPVHIIATMRSKFEYDLQEHNRDGKKVIKPVMVGTTAVQRDDTKYEFDLVGLMIKGEGPTMVIEKSRFNRIIAEGEEIREPGEQIANMVKGYLNTGTTAAMTRAEFVIRMNALGFDLNAIATEVGKFPELKGNYDALYREIASGR